MQPIGQTSLGKSGFRFLKWGPVQTPQGAAGGGPGGSLRLVGASIGTRFPGMAPTISNWDRIELQQSIGPEALFAAIECAASHLGNHSESIAIPISALPITGQLKQWDPIDNWRLAIGTRN